MQISENIDLFSPRNYYRVTTHSTYLSVSPFRIFTKLKSKPKSAPSKKISEKKRNSHLLQLGKSHQWSTFITLTFNSSHYSYYSPQACPNLDDLGSGSTGKMLSQSVISSDEFGNRDDTTSSTQPTHTLTRTHLCNRDSTNLMNTTHTLTRTHLCNRDSTKIRQISRSINHNNYDYKIPRTKNNTINISYNKNLFKHSTTFRSQQIPPDDIDYDYLQSQFRYLFNKVLPRALGFKFKYLAVLEHGLKNGRAHYHVLTDIPFDNPIFKHYLNKSRKILPLWQGGYSDVAKLDRSNKCIFYLLKYLGKAGYRTPIGKREIFASRGLCKVFTYVLTVNQTLSLLKKLQAILYYDDENKSIYLSDHIIDQLWNTTQQLI